MVGARTVPAYIEWYTVQKVMANTLQTSKEGFTLYQFRRDFDLKAADVAAARKLILDEYWDHRLDSSCCIPVIKYADAADET